MGIPFKRPESLDNQSQREWNEFLQYDDVVSFRPGRQLEIMGSSFSALDEKEEQECRLIPGPIPVRVVGSEPSGYVFTEETEAIGITPEGARIILAHDLLPDDLIALTNLQNGIEEDFQVIGAVMEVSKSRQEWGIEPLNPESEIWGSMLQEVTPESECDTVWIRCAACKVVILDVVSSIEHNVLLAHGDILRYCDHCASRTFWKL